MSFELQIEVPYFILYYYYYYFNFFFLSPEVEKQLEQQTPLSSTFKKHGGSNSNIQALSTEEGDQGKLLIYFYRLSFYLILITLNLYCVIL